MSRINGKTDPGHVFEINGVAKLASSLNAC